MKNTTGNKIRLGIFVSISMAVFIATIYFIGQKQQLFSSSFHISGIFKNVSGLQVGNNVRFCGINVGMIEDIEQVTDSTVRVDMVIDEQARKFIKKNAKAIIGSDGLMGNKMMLLVAGTPGKRELSDMDTIETAQPVNMDDILLSLQVTADNAASITDDLSMIMNNISEGKGTIGKLFMDSTFSRNVDEAMVNIKQGAGGFKQNMDAASHNFLLKGYLKKKVNDKTKK
ncbi:MAG TPA: MlaD family protein [Cytophagaceae bacterium]|jgi:phospholipid/cholesterol/gamma-HCH transport system substrate-binding protein|nr:MlaD family protein [Cytophagaceae bacterium]